MQAGKPLVDENGPIAVVPVERQKTGLPGTLLRRLGGELCVQRRVAAQDHFDPPFENVADGRLAGLDAEEAGQDRAFHDAADAGNVGDRLRSAETTAQSQVEVPITLTSVPSRTPQPIAP